MTTPMPSPRTEPPEYIKLTQRNIPLAESIARRLSRRYGWVDRDDLKGYAYLGLTLAARAFDSTRGVPFERFACRKAMFLAIDEMRKDGILHRADSPSPSQDTTVQEMEMPDPAARRAHEILEAREFCEELFKRVDEASRQLLGMVYADKLTYREIAEVFNISESAVCLRHKAVIQKLRMQAAVRRMAA